MLLIVAAGHQRRAQLGGRRAARERGLQAQLLAQAREDGVLDERPRWPARSTTRSRRG